MEKLTKIVNERNGFLASLVVFFLWCYQKRKGFPVVSRQKERVLLPKTVFFEVLFHPDFFVLSKIWTGNMFRTFPSLK